MKKDYIFGVIVMLVVLKLTDNLYILDNWFITHLVRLILGFVVLFIASMILKKVFQKGK
ncbi:hypothetical protein ABEX30_08170 [Priestia aryabhattai]|uniref:hypothetical protein n=1 Tax=Priestia TaxID=2800373 RepID=UPI00232F36F4|nr:hypothetical protein [Priestia sp. AB]MDC0705826.1 hypothetical protein [Priestia sp. AB]MED4213264.1 hypothetical protein [Priestia megaterium]